MFQCLAQFSIAFLDFLEQPHIFDGDDSLVSESLEKRDLFICERSDLHTSNENSPNRNTFAQQWNSESRPSTPLFRGLPEIPVHFAFLQDVVNMYRLPVENGSANYQTAAKGQGLADCKYRGDTSIARHFAHAITLDAIDLSVYRLA